MVRRLHLHQARYRRRPGLRRAAAAAAMVFALPGCGFSGLNFVQDDRLEIVHPTDRAKIRFPLTVRWRVTGFEVTGPDGSPGDDAGYFGLYIDRAPQAPGETQVDLVREDPGCQIDPECPGPAYLARQNIHSTDQTSFTIEEIPDPTPQDRRRGRRFHDITIVLLNGRGERIGESAYSVRVEV